MFAAGQQETTMEQAKILFMEKKYDEATARFAQAWRENPEVKQESQAFIDEIMRRIRRTNEIKEEIKTELYDNKNIEATVKLIDELREIDPDVEEYIKEIDKGIRVIYNYNQFTKYMDEGYQLVLAEKFPEAVTAYFQGFTLHREEFYENTTYGNIIPTAVKTLIQQTEQQMAGYAVQAEKTKTASARLKTLLSDTTYDAALKQIDIVYAEFTSLLDYRKQQKELGRKLIEQNEQIKKITGTGQGDNFLFYAYQTILGRVDKDTAEGLFFVIEKHWEQIQDMDEQELKKAADILYTQAKQALGRNSYTQAKQLFIQAQKLYGYGLVTVSGYFDLMDDESIDNLSVRAKEIVKLKYPLYLYYISRTAESRVYPELIARRESYTALKGILDSANSAKETPKLMALRPSIKSETDALYTERLVWVQREKLFQPMSKEEALMQKSLVSSKEVTAYIDSLLAEYAALKKGSAVKIASLEYAPLLSALEDKEKRFEEGVTLRGNPGREPEKPKYPTRAINIYEPLITEVNTFETELAEYKKNWQNEEPDITEQPEIQELIANISGLQTRLTVLQTKLLPEVKATQQQQLDARTLRSKGQDEFNRAKTAEARNDFKTARERADEATVSYTKSLLYEEDAGVRKLLTDELPKFSSESYIAWQNKIIDDVRKAILESERFTANTQFNEAEQVLIQAENLWKQVDENEENAEVKVALERVRFAKEYTNSRVIEPTHPMYGNVTSWLNLANQYYNEGIAFEKQGKKDEADIKFNQANDNIRNIKTEFPYHEESSILELKIKNETLTKPEFDEIFKIAFDRINEKIKLNGKIELPDLAIIENLYAINPNYPGLAAARKVARLALKIDEPQITPVNINRSNELYQQAVNLIKTKTRDNYIAARNLLNQALTINPKNIPAKDLFYQVSRELGGDFERVLSREDQGTMIRIYEAIKAGNRPLAIQLLQPLIPKYPANSDVLRLKGQLGL